ncbi:ribosomal protein L3 [Coprinellus micaceus]|uniref:Large ribosomal subunit protein uL3m n=1 Tax=Coprinellus micaceus TaxID=71717 RepID=A0A4Y7TQF4_COPMI|nr:ribosomal protein L3 [Coprinellus micaceus]
MLRTWVIVRCKTVPVVCQARLLHTSLPARSSAEEATTSTTPETQGEPKKWTPKSTRTGLIAVKRGMTSMWNDQGVKFPVTILQVADCQVTKNIKVPKPDHTVYHAVQVAAVNKPAKAVTRQMLGHFKKANISPKRYVKEFPVTSDAHLPVGTTLSAIHFVPGQYVDCVATSIGKGFQGTMKKWGFGGLAASHGVSVSHRSAGSTGQHQDPGRVFPGKKMAGHMGGNQVTVQNLAVVRVDTSLNLIYVRGAVPGVDDAPVYVRDAKKIMAQGKAYAAKGRTDKILPKGVDDLPFPAGTEELAKTLPSIIEAPAYRRSPFVPPE